MNYQLPILSLTQEQIDMIVLQGLPPKLHMNNNTARSTIFGPELLGGLNLPNLYTS
jgi:hypothetical protein